ncbi:phage tail protein [Neisseria elongata]
MPQPKLLSKPWASDGLKNNIPAERNGGLAQEAATYAEGFPSITMTPISVGGKPPSGKDMNGVLYEISAHTVWQNQGGRYRFDQTFCDAIGGYPKGSVLISDTLDTEYISLVDANTHNPNSGNNTGKWAIHAGKGLKASTTQAGSTQLSSATNSNRDDIAATPKAVKAAYDKAEEAARLALPSGAVMYFAGQTAPAGWLKANGAAVSRTAYAALFAAIGTTYGAGDGSTTFNLPDLRGEFIRGWDDGRGIDRGRAFGSAQGDAIRNITGSIDTGSHNGQQLFDEATAKGALAISRRQWKKWTADSGDGGDNPAAFDFDASRVVPTAAENRPRNIALLACIKI